MPTWERWRKRLDEIENLIGDTLELPKTPDILRDLKLLEADTCKIIASRQEWPANVQTRLYSTLIKLIDIIWNLLKSTIALSLRQSLYTLCLVSLRTLGHLLSIKDCSIAAESTSMLLDFIDKIVFTKILYSSDLVCIAVHLWVTVQRKFFDISYTELMNTIETKQFPESIKLACINSLICEFPDPELLSFIYEFDQTFFLHPQEPLHHSDNEVNVIKAKYCLQLCQSLNKTTGKLPQEVEDRLFFCTYNHISDRLETSVDIIKQLCFDSLRNLLQYDHLYRKDELGRLLLSRIDSYLDDYQGSLFHAICIAVEILGVEKSFIFCPSLVDYCFKFLEDRNDVPNYLVDLVARICSHKLQIFVDKLTQTTSNASLKVIDVIIPKLCKKDPFIINRLVGLGLLDDPKVNLKFKLKLLHLCNNQPSYNEPLNTQGLLRESIYHYDESTRLQSLGVIIETRKLSTPLPAEQLDLIKESLNMGLTIQEPCNRQRFLVLMDKLFKRLKCSLETAIRESRQQDCVTIYKSFVIRICEICFNNLYIDGYFARRTLALELIQMIINNFSSIDEFEPKNIFSSLELSSSIYITLMNCLIEDSLEETKQLVITVLVTLVKTNVIQLTPEDILLIREKAFTMLLNINPINVISASYLFRCLTKIVSLDDLPARIDINLDLLGILTDQVEKAILETKESIIDGAVYNPIHSRLTSIHGLIESLDLDCFTLRQPEWISLIDRIGKICFDASEVVSCIVCNDSPEGFLPMDLKPLDDELVNKMMGRECPSSPIVAEKRLDITSQMLLIFGWKTIKESSLILGKICEKLDHSPIDLKSCHPSSTIIDCCFVEKVLNYFVHHLKELKHRGAFEQAYTGFSMVVKCIWRKPCPCLKVVESLLDEILADLDNESQGSESSGPKCITRRSAGLPFVTQAIVSSEPKENRNKLLGHVINRLVEICSKQSAEDWQKVHCLNVIRALMKDQRLGDRVDSFIEDCLKLTISFFGYPNYSVSNSASILFSALMVRIFGVNRSKDYNHKKNSMSAKHFFLRFPSMDTFISTNIQQIDGHHVLPIILIILRLWPTIQESDCLLLAYKEPLESLCFKSPVAKIRDLAAQALAQVISAEEKLIFQSMEFICKQLNKSDLPYNHHDGLISFMYNCVRHHVKQIETDRSHKNLIASLTEHTSDLLESFKTGSNSSSSELIERPLHSYSRFIMTVEILLREQLIIFEDQMVCDLHTICLILLSQFKSNPQNVQFASCQDFLVKLIYFSLYYSPIDIRNKVIFILSSPTLPTEMIHFRTVLFKFLSDSLVKKLDPLEGSVRDEIMSDFELNVPEASFEVEPQTKVIEPIKVLQFISSCPEYKCLFENGSLTSFQPQRNVQQLFYLLHCAISRIPSDQLTNWSLLFDSCFTLFESVDPAKVNEETLALFYLILSDIWSHQINSSSGMLYHEKLNKYCEAVISICSIDRSDLSRKIAVTIVGSLLPILIKIAAFNRSRKFYLPSIASLWRSIPNLLQDNDPTIREFTAIMCHQLALIYFQPPTNQLPQGSLLNCSFQLLSSIFTNLDKRDSLRVVLFNLINDQKSISDHDDDKERFFDKSKINFIEDPIQLITIGKVYLEQLISSVDCNFFHSSLTWKNNQSTGGQQQSGLVDYFHDLQNKLNSLTSHFLSKLNDPNLTLEVNKMLIMIQLWIQSKSLCVDCDQAKKMIKNGLEINNYQSKVIFSIAGEIKSLNNLLTNHI
ncbi:uncharacterized protein LOC128394238 [Panonychus citri]|uniref:uncharacterized protein LOC128394238 n=1 Tax=Panonychus citri TaxID=50023 RepID=UPI0023071856|nr:uncharacterized protein LOC128394238 [Panonychus citri]